MKMKTLLRFSLIGLLAVSLFSCDLDDDAYSLGKFWIGFGLIDTGDSGNSNFTIEMDDGSVLYPINSYHSRNCIDDYERVLVNYTILGDKLIDDENREYYVRINSLKDILYKGIFDITPETEDSIGNDPIHVHKVWLSNNLLTFELDYYGYDKIHYINLVKEPGELTGPDQPIQLELRHNDRDDEKRYRLSALVTFDLEALQIAGQDTVQFTVTANDFEGEDFSYTRVYRY